MAAPRMSLLEQIRAQKYAYLRAAGELKDDDEETDEEYEDEDEENAEVSDDQSSDTQSSIVYKDAGTQT